MFFYLFEIMTKILSHFQRQHTELKKYANQQIDSMKSEIVRLHEKISSYKAEIENVEQKRLQSLKDIDSSLSEGKGKNWGLLTSSPPLSAGKYHTSLGSVYSTKIRHSPQGKNYHTHLKDPSQLLFSQRFK